MPRTLRHTTTSPKTLQLWWGPNFASLDKSNNHWIEAQIWKCCPKEVMCWNNWFPRKFFATNLFQSGFKDHCLKIRVQGANNHSRINVLTYRTHGNRLRLRDWGWTSFKRTKCVPKVANICLVVHLEARIRKLCTAHFFQTMPSTNRLTGLVKMCTKSCKCVSCCVPWSSNFAPERQITNFRVYSVLLIF